MKVYLDHNATTPALPLVKTMTTNLIEHPLNASSVHNIGREARNIIENARSQIAKLVGIDNAPLYKIIFTASGTESNNFIVNSFIDNEIYMSEIEHSSLIYFCKYFCNIKLIKVTHQGLIDCDHLDFLLSQSQVDKKLVTVMLANNETGIIQPIKDIANICKKYNAYLHSDCSQAPGKMALDIQDLGLDFATISAHKFGGLVGSGALIAKNINLLKPFIIGGGQEFGLRAGTENVIAINGFGIAANNAYDNLSKNSFYVQNLRDYLESKLIENYPKISIIGKKTLRLPNTSLIIMPNVKSEIQLIAFDLHGIAVSAGAACSSGKVLHSHVLKAMKISNDQSKSAIRISLAPQNTKEEIDYFIKIWGEIYAKNQEYLTLERIA